MLRELNDPRTDHKRRREIGDQLDKSGDSRPGVGVDQNGTPDIEWRAVAPGGQIVIEKQTFQVAPFYIAKYPVTHVQYEAFRLARDGFNNLAWWQGLPKEYQGQELYAQNNPALNSPRDRVSWYQSVAFGRWLSQRLRGLKLNYPGNASGPPLVIGENAEVRLPLEWEWQWAAQNGRQQRAYPWGEWQDGYANTIEAGLSQTIAVGMYPQGAAACGAMDLSGNIWEWCLNKYSNSEEGRVLRGGSFHSNQSRAACAFRNHNHPRSPRSSLGFRLMISSPSAL